MTQVLKMKLVFSYFIPMYYIVWQVPGSGPDVMMEVPIGVPQAPQLSEHVTEKTWQDSALTPSQRYVVTCSYENTC